MPSRPVVAVLTLCCLGGVAPAASAASPAARQDHQAEQALRSAGKVAYREALKSVDDYVPTYDTGGDLIALLRRSPRDLSVYPRTLPDGIIVRLRPRQILVCPRSDLYDLRLLTVSRSGRILQLNQNGADERPTITRSIRRCGVRKALRARSR